MAKLPSLNTQARSIALTQSPLRANLQSDPAFVAGQTAKLTGARTREATNNALPGTATWGKYRRYDYKTPGSALREFGLTPERAAGVASEALSYVRPTQTPAERAATLAASTTPLGQAQTELSQFTRQAGRGPELLQRRAFLRNNGITLQSSPKARSDALDSYWRMLQHKNQLPPRGLASSLAFQLAFAALSAGFGSGALLTAGANALGSTATSLLPAINAYGAASTAYDIGKAAVGRP